MKEVSSLEKVLSSVPIVTDNGYDGWEVYGL
jgi:hypothetical protein